MSIGTKHEQTPSNEYEVLNDITAKCRHSSCDWQALGSLEVEINSGRTVVTSEIFELCKQHHEATRIAKGSISDHNQFFLFQNGEDVGFASVSSGGSTGMYNPPTDRGRPGK